MLWGMCHKRRAGHGKQSSDRRYGTSRGITETQQTETKPMVHFRPASEISHMVSNNIEKRTFTYSSLVTSYERQITHYSHRVFPQSHTIESMIITPEMNSTLKIANVQAQDVAFQHNLLSYLFGLLITTYIVWQYVLRTGVMGSAGSEPPMLPYWIPVLGHTFSFLTNNHNTIMSGRSHLKNSAQPFSLLIGGRRTYIVIDPRCLGEVFKKTKDLVYEPFIENLMTCIGVTPTTRDIMLNAKNGENSLLR
ncbi:hypothetical protein NXS19_010802 [Fusarium pseudograminearum]|nr:hypothetical protein NXS19_010802 [Fusarium pseudograminearum]